MEKFSQLAKKKNYSKFFSSIRTIVAIKFLKKLLFFSAENWPGAERAIEFVIFQTLKSN